MRCVKYKGIQIKIISETKMIPRREYSGEHWFEPYDFTYFYVGKRKFFNIESAKEHIKNKYIFKLNKTNLKNQIKILKKEIKALKTKEKLLNKLNRQLELL